MMSVSALERDLVRIRQWRRPEPKQLSQQVVVALTKTTIKPSSLTRHSTAPQWPGKGAQGAPPLWLFYRRPVPDTEINAPVLAYRRTHYGFCSSSPTWYLYAGVEQKWLPYDLTKQARLLCLLIYIYSWRLEYCLYEPFWIQIRVQTSMYRS